MATLLKNSTSLSIGQGPVVLLPLREYEALKRAVPEYYLSGDSAEETDLLVKGGLSTHAKGQTSEIKSLADLS